ncbi:hypothetical protein [Amycolatopsis sp. NPDC059657]|uniref:hypothetical protein n=1 Tax=Amycolatopsis sp. NPDC059657 TaxID=3346899 RepID=UPI003670E029
MSRRLLIAVLAAALFALAACAAGPNNVAQVNAPHIAGFWPGLWHGVISPVTFLISLFNDRVGVYDVHNNGGWYNFGFLLGVSIIFSGGGHTVGSTRRGSRSS